MRLHRKIKMKVLAVTGGIGSGKSHIVKMFSSLGIPAYFSDDRAKELYYTSSALLSSLTALLGDDIVVDGILQKDVMAKKIFSDKSLLIKVEQLVHPAVAKDFLSWKEIQCKKGMPFVIIESAIFLEKEMLLPLADKVLVVSAPLDLRIERIMERDKSSREQIMERLSHQWDDSRREKLADFVIVSDGSKALLPQVLDIYNKMK